MKCLLSSTILILVFSFLLVLSIPTAAHGQIEIEADPIAYIFNGYSGHVAYVFAPARASVGVFAIDVPEFFHGNEGWSSRSRGATIKLDFVGPTAEGFFVGLDSGIQRVDYTLDATGATEERDIIGLGGRAGYRLLFPNTRFYIAPWVGVSYLLDDDEIVVNGEVFDRGRIQVFPTVHLGLRF